MKEDRPRRHLPVVNDDRRRWLRRAGALAVFTVAWNLVGLAGVFAAAGAGSVVLLGFGITIALGGMALNATLGWWWADPVAALLMTPLLLREARQAWRGDICCD